MEMDENWDFWENEIDSMSPLKNSNEITIIKNHKFVDGKIFYLIDDEWKDYESLGSIAAIRNYWTEKEESFKIPLEPNSKILFHQMSSNQEYIYGVLMGNQIHLFTTEEISRVSPRLLIDYYQEHFS